MFTYIQEKPVKSLILYFLIFSLLSGLFIPNVNAQEPATGTPQDNACNRGGSMSGKCTTSWHWDCGWYIARWEAALYTFSQIPTDCSETLISPYLPVIGKPLPIPAVKTICHTQVIDDAEDTYCVSSDQTATGDWESDGTLDWEGIFVEEECPAPYEDYGETMTTLLNELDFIHEEISELGLLPQLCVQFEETE